MRAGVIGTGWFGTRHAEVLRSLGVEIAGCYSTNAEKAAGFAKTFGAKIFANAREMISRRNIDLLYIVVPPFAHDPELALTAAREKIPFLIEKPIGLDAANCHKIADAVRTNGLVTSVGYMLRESPLLPEARQVIARNRVSSVRACRMDEFPGVHWWRKMKTSGGPMVEQTTHVVDLIRYVFGEVDRVAAFASYGIAAKRYPDADVCDSMEAIMHFTSGAIGNVGLADTLNNGFSKAELFEVYGDDFYLSYDARRLRYLEGKTAWVERPQPQGIDLIVEENKRFLAAVQKNDPSAVLSPYADGVKTLELTLAMNESARAGAVVQVNPAKTAQK